MPDASILLPYESSAATSGGEQMIVPWGKGSLGLATPLSDYREEAIYFAFVPQ